MSYAHAHDGTRIYYEVVGPASAPPLLMIQGLGADRRGWVLQRAYLARKYRCIVFDNRGVGRSEKPAGPYDLLEMAEDAIAVLDAVGVDTAHVMGASMGGVIAQIVGVLHPDRVRSLVLSCTGCQHHPWRIELLDEWREVAERDGMRGVTSRALRWLVGPRARRRFNLPAQLFGSILIGTPAHGFISQVQAILSVSDEIRGALVAVQAPTLIIVGSQDILTPVGDSEELHELIPGSRLVVLHGAAHAVMVEQAVQFNRAVHSFLDEVCAAEGEAARIAAPVLGAVPLAGA